MLTCREKDIKTILINTAKKRQTITYSQLIQKCKQKEKQINRFSLVKLLHNICKETFKQHGFMLGALVVSKKDKIPSEGFFKLASKLYNISFETQEEKLLFWKKQLEKIYKEIKD